MPQPWAPPLQETALEGAFFFILVSLLLPLMQLLLLLLIAAPLAVALAVAVASTCPLLVAVESMPFVVLALIPPLRV